LNAPPPDSGRADHALLMDKVYRHQRHIYDLTRKYYLLGRDRLVRELDAKPGECIVEIGCGTARNLIRTAETYPGTALYGLDASLEMLRTATESVSRAGLAGRITLKHALAENLTPDLFGLRRPFDHAIFSYSLSMIPDWRGALRQAAQNVGSGGFVHVVDFGDLKSLWPVAEMALRAWLGFFHVSPRGELLGLLDSGIHPGQGRTLRTWPGRYAFLLKASPSAIKDLVD
jgi:S-adenosylmethionine-diacylgycerolhomoserine-N-methlytransferase